MISLFSFYIAIAQWLIYLNWNFILKPKKFRLRWGNNRNYLIGSLLFFNALYLFLILLGKIKTSENEVLEIVGIILLKGFFVVSLIILFLQLFIFYDRTEKGFIKRDLLIDLSSIGLIIGVVLLGV